MDLTDRSMAPGGRGYVKLLTGLKSRLQLQTDFLLSHHPGDIIVIVVSVTPDALLLIHASVSQGAGPLCSPSCLVVIGRSTNLRSPVAV